ncbi:DUF4410 domain-containing protein [Gammaproteobacteria bacterium]|nr:DUF4410 domain-containing protein [Gammaproteobacteria bacterium]
MKRLTSITVLITIVFLVSACASHRYTVLEPSSKNFTDYKTLEIRDFKTTLADEESKELARKFADRLYTDVMKDRKEHPDEIIFEEVVRSTDKTDDVLILDGTIISFDKGSKAKRYFIGFGAGKAYCTIQSIFTDKETGETVQKINFDGELSGGIFGGTVDEAVQGVVSAYLDFFDDYFDTQNP